MEEKRRDVGNLSAASPSAGSASGTTSRLAEASAPEPTSTRRRAGGQKRKANNTNAFGGSSAPSKRQAREKPPILQPPIHNGPCTRARQTPSNLTASASAASAASGAGDGPQRAAEPPKLPEDSTLAVVKEAKVATVDWGAMESAVDAQFESIRSRDPSTHAVPIPCGWFSWTKVHPIEELTLPSFFNGKTESRTANIYMEIRNWIMKKFHADPKTEIELKHVSELKVGDEGAKQEVMEFLDHWGLINFHPFPPAAPEASEPGDDGPKDMESSLEDLYRFESVQSSLPLDSKSQVAPALPSGWFPECAMAEDLVKPEGPSVEYHCNSCSADCSRKRYHCQKQADYDLCTECYNSGKFDSDMAPSDFILMEPAEVPGLSTGKWTDQETLLLLEALELFNENWNEIAEHVATKTKAQCILHFVQMPIEDRFLDCNDEVDANTQETANPQSIDNDSSVHEEVPERTENITNVTEGQPTSSPMEISKPEDAELVASAGADKGEAKDNFALKALTEAFAAIGSLPEDGGHLSFADAGNPVMALAAYMVRLVEPDISTASARCSLKSLSVNAPNMHLATRHCFLLEDPPDGKKEMISSDRAAAELVDDEKNKMEENPISDVDDNNKSSHVKDDIMTDYVPEDKEPNGDSTDKSLEKDPGNMATNEEVIPAIFSISSQSDLTKDLPASTEKKSEDIASKSERAVSPAKESIDLISKSEPPASPAKESVDLTSHSEPSASPAKGSVDSKSKSKPSTGPAKDHVDSKSKLECPASPAKELVDLISKSEPPSSPTEISVDLKPKCDPLANPVKELVDIISKSEQPASPEKEPPVSAVKESIDTVVKSEPPVSPTKEVGDKDCTNKALQRSEDLAKDPPQCIEVSRKLDLASGSLVSTQKEPEQLGTSNTVVENVADSAIRAEDESEVSKIGNSDPAENNLNIDRLRQAAVCALSAAAVKAKLLADQEEDHVRQLATSLIEKQLYKLETKMAFFNEMENVIARVREQLDRSRQKLYHERAQIIAARFGQPLSGAKTMAQPMPTNRITANFANSMARPQFSMSPQRPPMARPVVPSNFAPPNPFVSPVVGGSSVRPSVQDKLSSVGMK